jgi:hypothetical protein
MSADLRPNNLAATLGDPASPEQYPNRGTHSRVDRRASMGAIVSRMSLDIVRIGQ